jgi:two-component system, NtrC family, sensor kinase
VKPAVLVVDDSLTIRMDLEELLTDAGMRVVTCSSVAEARAALDRETFSLAVLDVLLPDGDGIELVRAIRASASNAATAVMLLSSEAEVRDRVRGLTTGADEYVGKPYDRGWVASRALELVRRAAPSARASTPTVLVIDDSKTFAEELRAALEADGYRVLTASTGEDGLRLAFDAAPHALVVDGELPGIDGITVIRRVRLDAALRRLPCILLTGAEPDQMTELRALETGADAFARKDGDLSVVRARVAALLRGVDTTTGGAHAASVHGPRKLLVVDDSDTYREEIGEQLRLEGYEVVLARCGEDALEMLAAQTVDGILLDLLMPGIGGHETCRRVRAAPAMREVPIIMLTGLDDRAAMIEGLGAGADDFISKSSDFGVLKARIRTQVRRRQSEEENRRITERMMRKEMEATEARTQRELAETRATLLEDVHRKNQELEAFAHSVSHDLRAPLRSVSGYGPILLQEHAAHLDATGQTYLRRILAAATRMTAPIDDILMLSRVGREQIRRERIDFSALAREVARELQDASPDRQGRFEIPQGLEAEADPALTRIALDNLIGNAWKFTAPRDPAVIELGMVPGRPPTYFVRDNGVGFDMQHADKVFAAFERLHTQREFPGTGIGLATVQRVVQRHGGRIWAESQVGVGTTFFFTLAVQ